MKIKCCFHESSEIIPPQLQGSLSLKAMMAATYIVKAVINKSEAYKPFNRQRGIINNNETKNSVRGNAQAIKGAMGFKMGDSEICSLKTPYSINLLIPVYKKSITKRKTIVSTSVDFDNQPTENKLLF